MTSQALKKVTLVIAATAIVVAVLAYAMLAPTTAAQTATNTTTSSAQSQSKVQIPGWSGGFPSNLGGQFSQRGGVANGMFGMETSQVNVSVGQTITVTSTQGRYQVAGTPTSNGTASGTVTFTVTGKLTEGYTLSVTSGSVTVGSTTYTITSGSAQMNREASSITGQGAVSPTGVFVLQASARGSFVGSTGLVSLDLQSGASEYLVSLTGTTSG